MNVVAKFKQFISIFKRKNYVSIKRVKKYPSRWIAHDDVDQYLDNVSPIKKK